MVQPEDKHTEDLGFQCLNLIVRMHDYTDVTTEILSKHISADDANRFYWLVCLNFAYYG